MITAIKRAERNRVRTAAAAVGQVLRDLRRRADLTITEAATQVGISQSKLSRLETGGRRLHDEDMDRLCALYRASDEERATIRELRNGKPLGAYPRLTLSRVPATRLVERVADMRDRARVIKCFQPVRVPEILQTVEYGQVCAKDWSAEHDAVVSEDTERATFILTEGALRWCVGGPEVMVAQLDALIEASRVRGVRLGVIPWYRPVDMFARHGWTIYDSRLVLMATEIALGAIEDRRDIAAYERMWERVRRLAVWGDSARSEIERVREEYAGLGRCVSNTHEARTVEDSRGPKRTEED